MQNNLLFEKYQDIYNIEIVDLWNEEIGFIFKLDYDLFQEKVNNKYLLKSASWVCFDNNKIVGFIIGKRYDNDPDIPKYYDKGWISLFYVSNRYRNRGIGNNLLEKCEEELIKSGVNSISVGSDLYNFFPGIPSDFDNLTDTFLKKRGYEVGRYTHDLIKILDSSDYVEDDSTLEINCSNNKETILFRYAKKEDEEKVMAFFKEYFFGRWYSEAKEYFLDNDIVSEYLIALHDNKVIGFLRCNFGFIKKRSYNNTWALNFNKLVGVGPLGIAPNYRNNGIAKHLLKKCASDAYKMGYKEAMIDWTGLMSIYQKYGYQVWKCYAYTSKNIK